MTVRRCHGREAFFPPLGKSLFSDRVIIHRSPPTSRDRRAPPDTSPDPITPAEIRPAPESLDAPYLLYILTIILTQGIPVMDTTATLSLKDLLIHIVGGIAKAVCERPGEPQPRQFARTQAAAQTIMAFQPRDAIEAMLAGHCLMFHELIVDDVHAALRDGAAATRSGIVAMDKAFGANLTRLQRHRAHDGTAAEPAEGRAETEIADRVRRHQARTEPRTRTTSDPAPPEAIRHTPSPEAISDAADLSQSPIQARGTGLTAARMAGLNRQARRAIDRQARKHGGPATARMANLPVSPIHNGAATTISAIAAG